MAYSIQVAGPVLIRTDIALANTLVDYGYTAGGVQITSESFSKTVPCDDHGGEDGIPADIQDLGEIHRIRLEMTKFDATQDHYLAGRVRGYAGGAARPLGTLIIAGSKYFKLVLATTAGVAIRTYSCASLLRTPHDVNKGSVYSRHVLEVECFPDPSTGVLYT